MTKKPAITPVLVLGANGMFGRMAVSVLRENGPVISVGRNERISFAVEEDDEALLAILEIAPCSLVINAIGTMANGIDPTNSELVTKAMLVNAVFPHRLVANASKVGSRVIHISTDAVFPASAGIVTVKDNPSPEDLYGISKLAGEPYAKNALTIRCSIIGPGNQGLWHWLEEQSQGAVIKGYSNHYWSGCTTRQLALLCGHLRYEKAFENLSDCGSIHHYAPNPVITKFELLKTMRSLLRPDVTIESVKHEFELRRILVDDIGFRLISGKRRTWGSEIAECASFSNHKL